MEKTNTPDVAAAPASLLATRASNQPADTAPAPSDPSSLQDTWHASSQPPKPGFSTSTSQSLAARPRAAEELHATVRRTGDGGVHVLREHMSEMRSGGPAIPATPATPAAPRQEVLVRPRKWAVGGRHQQNYVRLGWKWNHRFAAKMRKDAQKKRDEQEKKDAEDNKKGPENPAVPANPDNATLDVPTTSHSAAEVKEGVPAVDGAQDGSMTQGTGVDNVDGKEPKKDEAKGSTVAKETAFSKLKRMASLLVG
ncbi:hypothetical protein IQ07DRAFT_603995 [Pyrenochaeta sp. DS3sAY3a]|nr:hypothetical protein IQ07DRAFT_603995 [Pyrenochaeta sp. DS3sAY3a]